MITITKEEVLKLASISNILIEEDEAELFAKELQAVLNYASSLQEIAQTYSGPEISITKNSNIMRDDRVIATPNEPLIKQAPVYEGNFIVVPKIIKN